MTTIYEKINDVSPTVSLLLAILRFSQGTISKENLEIACTQGIDWDIFNDLIQHHRLESLIHDKINGSMDNLFPEATLCLLKQKHMVNVGANLFQSAKAFEILREFETKQIPVLLVKGLAVESWLYEKPGIRPSGDIDLFIHPDDQSLALSCMNSMGYELVSLSDRLTPGSRLNNQFKQTHKDFELYHNKSKISVELHWRLSLINDSFPLTFDDVWHSRNSFDIRGKSIQTLPQDMHAVFLCYHGAKHSWEKLFWLYDIAQLMLNDSTDWHAILKKAQELKAISSLGLALVLTSQIFLIPIPKIINPHDDIIKTGERLSDIIIYNVLADIPIDNTTGFVSNLKAVLWRNRINPSKTHFLSEWVYYLTSPDTRDLESIKLPDSLTSLYKLWRPIRMIAKLFPKVKI